MGAPMGCSQPVYVHRGILRAEVVEGDIMDGNTAGVLIALIFFLFLGWTVYWLEK